MRDVVSALTLLGRLGARHSAALGAPDDARTAPWLSGRQVTARLEAVLDAVARRWSVPEPRVAAVMLLNSYAGRLARVAAGCLVLDAPAPRLRPHDVLVRFGDSALVRDLRLTGPAAVASGPVRDLERMRRDLLESHLAPLIARMTAIADLGDDEGWALVADALAGTCLTVGRALGDEELGRRQAERVVSGCRPPLRRPVRFLTVSGGGRTELAVQAQGCCLTHRLPNATRCVSCPERPADERRALMGSRLAGSAPSAPVLQGAAAVGP